MKGEIKPNYVIGCFILLLAIGLIFGYLIGSGQNDELVTKYQNLVDGYQDACVDLIEIIIEERNLSVLNASEFWRWVQNRNPDLNLHEPLWTYEQFNESGLDFYFGIEWNCT